MHPKSVELVLVSLPCLSGSFNDAVFPPVNVQFTCQTPANSAVHRTVLDDSSGESGRDRRLAETVRTIANSTGADAIVRNVKLRTGEGLSRWSRAAASVSSSAPVIRTANDSARRNASFCTMTPVSPRTSNPSPGAPSRHSVRKSRGSVIASDSVGNWRPRVRWFWSAAACVSDRRLSS